MLNLSENNIHLSAQAENKQQAIELIAQALEQAGYVEEGYLQGMLGREKQTSTFLGNGIAIPHGTLETRHMVKNTGVQVFQFPQGIQWDEENLAYVVIGIAARSDEHLALLRQLTHVLGDEEVASKLATMQDIQQFRAILMGEETFNIKADNISLDVETESLLTLTAINAGKLLEQSAVNHQFVSDVIASPALPLGNGLWITDAVVGNKKNSITFSRAQKAFTHHNKLVQGVITVSAINDQLNTILALLLNNEVQQVLLTGQTEQILAALNGTTVQENNATNTNLAIASDVSDSVIGTFTIRNEHGLHARPSAVLVNEVKKFTSKITVTNINRGSEAVNAKSLMKIVALGVTQGHRLRFVAQGEDAKQAIEAIGKIITEGLGETISAIPPQETDTIEVVEQTTSDVSSAVRSISENNENLPSDSLEAIFIIKNEHGLHARPSAVLVNEVKKYKASIAVQNLDRNSQLVSAKSLMKIVALGVVKGHRLRFIATGEDAQQALESIGKAIEAGLGE